MRGVILLVVGVLGGAQSAVAASSPSPSACALAWNHGAGARLRALVVADHARGAFIDARASVGTDTWSKAGGASSTSSPGCVIEFVLRGRHVVLLWGAWQDAQIPKWSGPVSSTRPIPVPVNARVHDDGTVGFHG